MSHPHHATTAVSLRPATHAWLWGGSAILVSGLLRVLQALPITAMLGSGPVTLMAATSFAIGMVILALGVRGQGSIVARSRTGVTALFVLAGLEVAQSVIIESFAAIPASMRDGVIALSDVLGLIQLIAASVASVVIIRAGAVRGALRWMPLTALVLLVGLQLAIRIALGARGGIAPTGIDIFVFAQVAMALLDAALGFIVMLASPRAGVRGVRTT